MSLPAKQSRRLGLSECCNQDVEIAEMPLERLREPH